MEKVVTLTEDLKSLILDFLYKDEMFNINLIEAISNNNLGDLYLSIQNNNINGILHSRFDGNSKFTNFAYDTSTGLYSIIKQIKTMDKEKMLLAGRKSDVLQIINTLYGKNMCDSDMFYKYDNTNIFTNEHNDLCIRKSRINEQDKEILKRYFIDFFGAVTTEEINNITNENIIEKDLEEGTYFLEKDNKVVGMARICAETQNYAEITAVYIEPKFRGLSYGKVLMKHMVDIILSKNKIPVLQTSENNVVARKLYEDLGFVKIDDYSFEFL